MFKWVGKMKRVGVGGGDLDEMCDFISVKEEESIAHTSHHIYLSKLTLKIVHESKLRNRKVRKFKSLP